MFADQNGQHKDKSRNTLRAGLAQAALCLCVLFALTGCGKQKQTVTPSPNSQVDYEKGSDLTGVVKEIDTENQAVTFYNPVIETEETFLYNSATSIQTKSGAEMSMAEVQPGEVYDLYVEGSGSSNLAQMKATEDLIEEESSVMSVDPDNGKITVDGVKYEYSDHMVTLSDGTEIDPMEITDMDRVTFRGIRGKAYSVVVTRGHGYIEPVEYADFVGGTLYVEGETILPVTEGMLLTVPEGRQTVSMKNGDLTSKADLQVERGKVATLNMKESMTQVPETARVSFHIHPSGAELYINGAMVDYSKPISLYYGMHTVQVVLEGYNTYQGTIRVKDPEPTFRIDLSEEVATVEDKDTATGNDSEQSSVTTDEGNVQNPEIADYDVDHKITVSAPDGAAVYINGAYKGVAPCSFTKCVGKITLTLQKEGYETKSYTMEIIDDSQDTSLSFPDLKANN